MDVDDDDDDDGNISNSPSTPSSYYYYYSPLSSPLSDTSSEEDLLLTGLLCLTIVPVCPMSPLSLCLLCCCLMLGVELLLLLQLLLLTPPPPPPLRGLVRTNVELTSISPPSPLLSGRLWRIMVASPPPPPPLGLLPVIVPPFLPMVPALLFPPVTGLAVPSYSLSLPVPPLAVLLSSSLIFFKCSIFSVISSSMGARPLGVLALRNSTSRRMKGWDRRSWLSIRLVGSWRGEERVFEW